MKKLHVYNFAVGRITASDLVHMFNPFVKVQGVEVIDRNQAYVYVANKCAARAVQEQHGRVICGEALQVQLATDKQHDPGKLPEVPRVTSRRPDLKDRNWRFGVRTDKATDFAKVLDLFRQYGTVVWSCCHVDGIGGYVLLKTPYHWLRVTQGTDFVLVGGYRIRVTALLEATITEVSLTKLANEKNSKVLARDDAVHRKSQAGLKISSKKSLVSLLLSNISPNVNASDIIYLLSLYVDLQGLSYRDQYAYAYVPDRSQAAIAIRELNFRVIGGQPIQVRIAYPFQVTASITKPTIPRERPWLKPYCWRFLVSNIHPEKPLKHVTDLFRRFGRPIFSFRNVTKPSSGWILLETDQHWTTITEKLNKKEGAGVVVTICGDADFNPFVVDDQVVEEKRPAEVPTSLYVSKASTLSLDASDLAYLFGLYAEVVGVYMNRDYAFVTVKSQSQAVQAVHELNGRFVGGPTLPPLEVSLSKDTGTGSNLCFNLPPARKRPDLSEPIWGFVVKNIDPEVPFEQVRQHFLRFGTICSSVRHANRTYGSVFLKTSHHWRTVAARLDGVKLGGHRLSVFQSMRFGCTDVDGVMAKGEKNNGYEVLYQNMKYGLSATKELAEYFRERSNLEEYNSKLLTKLANKAGSGGGGTFSPLWIILKSTTERLSELHAAKVQKLSELVKNITKYAEELHKKHKTVKEEESGTQDAVQAMKDSTAAVAKAKDVYNARLQELEKARKDSSTKETEKAEAKLRKQQDDYKALVEKHNIIKQEFEKKMTITCKRFQDLEEAHLKQMKEFLTSYMEIVQNNFDLVGQVHHDLKRQFLELTVDKLLEQFVLNKYTGLEKPVSGFLRSRREKAKSKKTKKKKDSAENSSAKDDKGSDGEDKEEATVKATDAGSIGNLQTTSAVSTGNVAPTATPEVDEDGYSIQPRDATWDSATITEKSNNFYSSSDSDSDDERGERKIHVEIKPLNNGVAPISASVDELRATVENLSLSPIAPFSSQHSHHHSSASHHLTGTGVQAQSQHNLSSTGGGGGGGTAQPGTAGGLLNNNNNTHLTSPNASNASTPTTVHPYAPLQSPTLSMSTTSNNRYADLGDIFSEVGDISASAPASANLTKLTQRQIPTPTSAGGSSIAIPRPPSRRSEAAAAAAGRGRVSPASQIARADSVGSLEFRSPSVGIGSSRGPSPLTIGMSDTIPLAVAFHEIIHAYFRGSDETRCQVKMSGDMMLSFPAGIVNVLANNPNPAKLGFRIKNLQNLENVLPNKQLITIDKLQSTALSTTLEFNMPVLTSILRRQSEQNPTAPYFNVDILKYQVKAKPGAASCPFQLVSYWKCEQRHTDIKIDYKYNSHAMAVASPLLNVSISVPVDGSVKNVQSKPHSAWQGESNRLVWNFTDISQHSDNGGVDTLRARLEVGTGPSNPALISTQFNCEGTTLSGIEFELVGTGYRLSLVKRRFVSGKYICEGDGVRGIKTPTPPNVGVLSPSPYSNKSAGSGGSG
ncbi:F-BAR domain only protein 2 isoform X7 [Culex pipiens pallens]|uniref:F-BAR domain only protein 2 isoform X7 n=1 Tax=Culex pipiens pallens TaxID=42434 RepID=UPI0019547352|nr:F-BAR domain only protein 2 isoform X7 [Culex pipiens pallens]